MQKLVRFNKQHVEEEVHVAHVSWMSRMLWCVINCALSDTSKSVQFVFCQCKSGGGGREKQNKQTNKSMHNAYK